MKLEELHTLWAKTHDYDESQAGLASYEIAIHHSKWTAILSKLKIQLEAEKGKWKKVYLERFNFYVDGPTKEQAEAGMTLPPKGRILKQEVQKYLDADDIMIQANLRLAIVQEKVDFATECVRHLNSRSYQINNYIEWQKFLNGRN